MGTAIILAIRLMTAWQDAAANARLWCEHNPDQCRGRVSVAVEEFRSTAMADLGVEMLCASGTENMGDLDDGEVRERASEGDAEAQGELCRRGLRLSEGSAE